MKKIFASVILSLALILVPTNVFANEEASQDLNETISIDVSKDEKDEEEIQLREKIKELIEVTKTKLEALNYIKEKMPNLAKRHYDVIVKAEKEANRAIKAAEEYLYGKIEEEKPNKPDKPADKPSVDKENSDKPEDKPSVDEENHPGNPNASFKDPKSPAYLEANGRIIGHVKSRIYHMPGGRFYKKVSIENAVFFNTEKEAQAAGYRKALR